MEKQGPESRAALCSPGPRRPCRGGKGQQQVGPTCPWLLSAEGCPCVGATPPARGLGAASSSSQARGTAGAWPLETVASSSVTVRGCPSGLCSTKDRVHGGSLPVPQTQRHTRVQPQPPDVGAAGAPSLQLWESHTTVWMKC